MEKPVPGTVLHSFHSTNSFHPNPYDGDAIWNTEGKQTMTFTVGHVGSLQRNGTKSSTSSRFSPWAGAVRRSSCSGIMMTSFVSGL